MKTNWKPQRIVGMIVMILLFTFTLSCLAASPPPESAPAEEAAAEPPQAEATSIATMATLKIASLTNPDGSLTNTASLSINSLGIGTLELDAPETLDIHDTTTVTLRLALEDEFTSLPEVPASDGEDDLPTDALRYTDQIDIYPVMNAELVGSGFEITSSGSTQKVILSNTPVEWMWSIKPKDTGTHSLRMIISIPVIVDEQRNILSTHTLQSIPVRIEVTETFGSKLTGALPWLIPTVVTAIGGIIGFILSAKRKR